MVHKRDLGLRSSCRRLMVLRNSWIDGISRWKCNGKFGIDKVVCDRHRNRIAAGLRSPVVHVSVCFMLH